MHSCFADGIRNGIFLLICAVLAGCAVDVGPYTQAQSMEAAVQTVLAKQGYYQGPIDGTIGPSTSRAIRNYQRDHRLTPTGTINPALAASMGLAPSVNAGPAPFYTGYPAYYSGYAAPAYYAPPAVINLGWGGGWPVPGFGNYWNRGWGGGWGGWGGYGYRGWGGGYRGYGGGCGGGYRGYGGGGYGHGGGNGWRR